MLWRLFFGHFTFHFVHSSLVNSIWNRWLREYFPTVIERRKWLRECRNQAVGDLVFVVTAYSPQGSWPIGRVVDVHQGSDGFIRYADFKVVRALPLSTKNRNGPTDLNCTTHIYTCPVHKLCLLEEDGSDVSLTRNGRGRLCSRRLIPMTFGNVIGNVIHFNRQRLQFSKLILFSFFPTCVI
jgi:Family of unknown function (DUF5641)